MDRPITILHHLFAPSAWAPYLINGDASSLSPVDVIAIDAWLKAERLPMAVDCEHFGFMWSHDAIGFVDASEGADCQRYTFITHTKRRVA